MSSYESEEDGIDAIVVDNGSYSILSGFAGNDSARSVVRNLITPNDPDAAQQKSSSSPSVFSAMQNGIITNLDHMEMLWHHIFTDDLRIDISERCVLHTDAVLNPKCNAEKIVESMFESFNVQATHVVNPCILASYASGRTTSCVVDVGHGCAQIMPIWAGYNIQRANMRQNCAGQSVTDYLMHLLRQKGETFSTSMGRELVGGIKEKHARILLDYEAVVTNQSDFFGYELPDGQIIKPGTEFAKCGEVLFDPKLFGLSDRGLHECVFDAINQCDIDTRKDLYFNIVVAGGCTMLRGLGDRLQKEVRAAMDEKGAVIATRCKIVSPPERKQSVWIGGSILASLSTFQQLWICADMYDEDGVNVVHRRAIN